MLKLNNISKSFKNKTLFVDLNYAFEEGNIYLIRGENGCGKSVLLKIMSGFSKPDMGEVIIDNKILYKDIDFIQDAGVSINEDDFISYLSGHDNLKVLLDINKKVDICAVDDLAKEMGLGKDFYNTPYRAYSQGMKQKLRLIQAFVENPKYILLDEPTNALDNSSIDILYNYIQNINNKESKIIIIVSHNDDKITSLADKIIRIENKKLIENEI